jgi:phosphoglycerate kinase
MRVDFNVALDKETGEITNDLRIRRALPTIRFALEHDARLILMSHLGRPKGEVDPDLSMKKVADRLGELLGQPVEFASDCIGEEPQQKVQALGQGEVLVLENLRFHAGEKENASCFASQLASLADYYVNDAFGTAHRAHASTAGVPQHLPGCIGFLIERELENLSRALSEPEEPFVAIMGGAKVSDKIEAIENLLQKANKLLVGGAMAYTFLKQQGVEVGESLVEEDKLDLAGGLLEDYPGKIELPFDHVCAAEISADAEPRTVEGDIPEGMIGLDIGPKTAEKYAGIIRDAAMVTWNGPMGYFEIDAFAEGTYAVARALAQCEGMTIVGGGETAESVEQLDLQEQVSHVSTGGGACLDYLAGKTLPAIAALEEE